ncbi:Dinitrogenase iron-molybdenum cofactor biosynthesis protein [Dissulfuribacter thermophilus]|uniref:Dinitrogenase iron-molybdenum cofactor biosynthesis protein n=1 Tax=Dissulfuribacter thermophilus TaxID=1156395 RepID=A0A1B9F5K3_9BACT|nr:NifB/NifX family molybdenum-iron cluster-binding protein [Dissulfuribacter thermophilus]OCC15190.1 Dinitrogenase iron-molybdenum cofactor biosynthesis protein [Dissulfuribacter thermophilus]
MKAAVSITDPEKSLDSQIDPRFGRAANFLLVDLEKGEALKVISNSQAMNLGHGAGIQAATLIVEEGADAVVSGYVGPKAFSVLNAAGIKVYSGAEGTVKEVINLLKEGKLTPGEAPSSNGHGMGMGRRDL